jgi:hypothetical protein
MIMTRIVISIIEFLEDIKWLTRYKNGKYIVTEQ